MPGLEEVQRYLTGIWLLVRGKQEGFSWLDLSADGVLRSFWAIVWCLPAMAVTWASWRLFYLSNMPAGTSTGPAFFLKLIMVDLIGWMLPLVLIALIAKPLGFPRALGPIITTTNWLSLPLSYAVAVPAALRLVLPGADGATSLLWLVLFFLAIAALFRLMRIITGEQQLLAAALTSIFILPPFVVGQQLQSLFGLMPG